MPTNDKVLSQGLLATITAKRMLAELSDSPTPLSRAEIAERSGISKPAISDAAKRLEEAGVIVDSGTRAGRRGGVATLFEINADRGHSVAIALDSTFVAIRATRLDGSIGFAASAAIAPGTTREVLIETSNGFIESAAQTLGSPLLAAAVSVADPVDPRSGETIAVTDSVFPAGHFDPLHELALHGAEAVVDNDVNWATLAERHGGTMLDIDNFLYVYLGSGLGAGLFVGGQLQRGARGLAGEIGHIRLPNGEDLTRALIRLGFGSTAAGYRLDINAASALLSAPMLCADSEEAISLLATAIANMATLLNSSAIVLGGPLSSHDSLLDRLASAVPSLTVDAVRVVRGASSPLDGASYRAHRLARSEVGF